MFTIEGIDNISNILDKGLKKQSITVIETIEKLLSIAIEKKNDTIHEPGLQMAIDLIELYIDNSHFDKANKVFEEIKSIIDKIDNLPRNAQNNLDFIEYKLKQINKK